MAKRDLIIVEDDREKVVNIGGIWRRDVQMTIPDDAPGNQLSIRRLAQGWSCLVCFEPFPPHIGSFPERCPNEWCGYEVKARQPADFERTFGGFDREIAKRDLDQYYEQRREELERERFIRGNNVWLP